MAIILGAWAAAALTAVGLGVLVERLARARAGDPLHRAWIGFSAALVLAQLAHLAFPLDGRVAGVICLFGLAGLALGGRGLAREHLRLVRENALAAAVLGLVALWLANVSLGPLTNADGGAYHVLTMRWYQRFAAVPGLGNLHNTAALNHGYFLYAALLDVGPLRGQAQHAATGLLLLALAAPALAGAARLLRARDLAAADVVAAFLLAPLLDAVLGRDLVSLSPDAAVLALGSLVVLRTLRVLARSEAPTPGELALDTLAAAATAIVKPPLALMALAFWGAGLLWRLRVLPAPARARATALVAGTGALAVVPWMAHGLVLTGYPLYPSVVGGLPVDWAIPEPAVRALSEYISQYARRPADWGAQAPAAGLGWVRGWLASAWLDVRDYVLPVSLAAAAALLALVQRLRGRALPRADLVPLAPTAVALALWFFSAPSARFAGPLLWTLPALLAWIVFRTGDRALAARLALLLLVVAVSAGAFVGMPVPRLRPPGAFAPLPPERVEAMTLPGGDVVKRQLGACWDPPCAQRAQPGVRLRRPGVPADGFTVR